MGKPEQPETPVKPELSEQTVTFLNQELDRMQTFHRDAMSNVQNVFNFYLTFASTVVGALVILMQISSPGAADAMRTRIILAGVLLFAAAVGAVYLSSLSGKYAHAARYAYAIDEIRRYLIDRLQVATPPVYERFIQGEAPSWQKLRGASRWVVWLIPTGTYEMFIAICNSAAWAGLTWLIATSGSVELGRRLAAALIVFLVSLTIHNAYSRLTMQRLAERFHIRIDIGSALSFWAARE